MSLQSISIPPNRILSSWSLISGDTPQRLTPRKCSLNASENLYKYVLNELFVYCVKNAQQVEIHRFAYFNPKTFTLYLYNGTKEVLKVSADNIETIENGDEGIMFTELNSYQPFKLVDINKKVDYVDKYLTGNLNVDTDSTILNITTQQKISEIWFYSLFSESIMKTKPIFAAIGTKGSGKTTFLRRVGQILFGEIGRASCRERV